MDKKTIIQKETEDLLEKLGFSCAVEVREENNIFTVAVAAQTDAPRLIGKFGETLAAIERILEAILYNLCKEKVELIVNINDYRERQVERLEYIAQNAASRVIEEQQSVPLRSFSAYERKIIHEYITRTHPDLTSYSEGEGDERMLVIAVKKDDKL